MSRYTVPSKTWAWVKVVSSQLHGLGGALGVKQGGWSGQGTKQDEAAEKIKEVIENTPETNGVEIGTEVTKGNDEWLSVKF